MLSSKIGMHFNVASYFLFFYIFKSSSFVIIPGGKQTADMRDDDSPDWMNPCDGQVKRDSITQATPPTVNDLETSNANEFRKDLAQYLALNVKRLAEDYSSFSNHTVERLNCGLPPTGFSDSTGTRKQALEQVASMTLAVHQAAELMVKDGYDMYEKTRKNAAELFFNSAFGIRTLLCVVSSYESEQSRHVDVDPTPPSLECQTDTESQRANCICNNVVMASKILNGITLNV